MTPPPVADRPGLPGGPYLVAGLARSGIAAALALAQRGEAVGGCDARAVAEQAVAPLRAAGVTVRAPDDGVAMLEGVATLVKSPGVPQEAPVVVAARERGVTVIGELELAWRLLGGHPCIAVTGSNGKTTTAELVGHVLRTAGVPVIVAGNVGTALSGLVGTLAPGTVVVCEASSFQLEDTLAFAPEAAVLLNLATDHLDRHGTVDAYHAAKLQIFARQPPSAIAVAPPDVDVPGEARRVRAELVRPAPRPGAEPDRGAAIAWQGEPVLPVADLALRGAHNLENALAAAAVCLAWGVERAAVAKGLATFPGVPHRLEEVATVGGVLYVNDSKATNVDAALTGIRSFPAGVHVILGGSGKGEPYGRLRDAVERHCVAVYVIGAEAERIASELGDLPGIPVRRSGDLDRAIADAAAAAEPGETVLLSPACASFDQYEHFERRGDHFRRLVLSLPSGRNGAAPS